MKDILDAKIPANAVQERTQGNTTLSYLAGWYVIHRLNEVFGHGNWSYDSAVCLIHTGKITQRNGEAFTSSYYGRVALKVKYPDGREASYTDYGYGDGTDKTSEGKAHELAIKEAVTDALKRAAKNLGMSFGLALYDKEQEYVEDTKATSKSSVEKKGGLPSKSKEGSKVELLRSTVIAAEGRKLLTRDKFVEHIKSKYGAESTDRLSPPQVDECLTYVKGLLNA